MSIKCIKSLYAFIKHQRYLATHLIWYFEWYYDQFSGPCLGNLRPKMMVLYGKIGLNIKTVGHCSLNSNFPSINFPRYMHCSQYKEWRNFTHLWAFYRGSGYLIIDLNTYLWVPKYNWLNHQNLFKLVAEFEFSVSVTKLL